MMTDPIADMLTRIRNATRNHVKDCLVLNSKVCRGIAGILESEDEPLGGLQVGIPGRDERHEGNLTVGAKLVECCVDG